MRLIIYLMEASNHTIKAAVRTFSYSTEEEEDFIKH